MAIYQKESGSCTGRGFSSTDANGYLAKFMAWIVKAPVSGGPSWNILLDKSAAPVGQDFTTDFNTGIFTSVTHGFYTGETVRFSTTGTLPAGINSITDYYIIKLDNDTYKIGVDLKSAIEGTALTFYDDGSGTHTAILRGPYIIVSNAAAPTVNQVCQILKVGFFNGEAAFIRVSYYTSFDSTNSTANGLWAGYRVATQDSGGFSYDFRGGDEAMILQSRIGTTWSTTALDTWAGDSNLVEGTDKTGYLTSGITAGPSVTLQLNTNEALNFTENYYYYLWDFSGHAWVDYVKCTGTNPGLDQITIDACDKDFAAGSVISAYSHRFCASGTGTMNSENNINNKHATIPYYSTDSTYNFNNQTSSIEGSITPSFEYAYLIGMAPNDRDQYAMEKVNIQEQNAQNSGYRSIDMNRGYGALKNTFVTAKLSMAQALDGRSYAGDNYLYFQNCQDLFTSNSDIAVLFLDSTSMA